MLDKRNPLAGLNLNLFPVLDSLLRHRSATRAAGELGVTPSAVSHSLRELRLIFDDPLFVRTRHGLEPTSRAQKLEVELRAALNALGLVVARESVFLPEESAARIVLATADDTGLTILPGFVSRVLTHAPNMTIDIRARAEKSMELLETGQADLLMMLSRDVPSWAAHQTLYHESMSVLARKDHPLIDGDLSMEVYLSASHIRVAPEGYGRSHVEVVLDQQGMKRHVAVYTFSFVMAPEFVANSNALLTMPSSMARVAAERLDLQVLDPPESFPGFSIDLVWHRSRDDQTLQWVREQLVHCAETYAHDRNVLGR